MVTLETPLRLLDGQTIETVEVRFPDVWDDNPAGTPQGIWNLAKATGLGIEDALRLTEGDVQTICNAIDGMLRIPFNRAERRKLLATQRVR